MQNIYLLCFSDLTPFKSWQKCLTLWTQCLYLNTFFRCSLIEIYLCSDVQRFLFLLLVPKCEFYVINLRFCYHCWKLWLSVVTSQLRSQAFLYRWCCLLTCTMLRLLTFFGSVFEFRIKNWFYCRCRNAVFLVGEVFYEQFFYGSRRSYSIYAIPGYWPSKARSFSIFKRWHFVCPCNYNAVTAERVNRFNEICNEGTRVSDRDVPSQLHIWNDFVFNFLTKMSSVNYKMVTAVVSLFQ